VGMVREWVSDQFSWVDIVREWAPARASAPLHFQLPARVSLCSGYGVATISRLLKITGFFCRIQVSFIGLFCKRDLHF